MLFSGIKCFIHTKNATSILCLCDIDLCDMYYISKGNVYSKIAMDDLIDPWSQLLTFGLYQKGCPIEGTPPCSTGTQIPHGLSIVVTTNSCNLQLSHPAEKTVVASETDTSNLLEGGK